MEISICDGAREKESKEKEAKEGDGAIYITQRVCDRKRDENSDKED